MCRSGWKCGSCVADPSLRRMIGAGSAGASGYHPCWLYVGEARELH
jgi:hypothetical protein